MTVEGNYEQPRVGGAQFSFFRANGFAINPADIDTGLQLPQAGYDRVEISPSAAQRSEEVAGDAVATVDAVATEEARDRELDLAYKTGPIPNAPIGMVMVLGALGNVFDIMDDRMNV